MDDPIIIDPPGFDQAAAWGECKQYVEDCGGLECDDSQPNWRALFGADPGLVGCPDCDASYWAWGRVQRCRKCGFVYPTDWWPMFSWGCQAGWGNSLFTRNTERHQQRMQHPYYRFGFDNPPDRSTKDLMKHAHTVDWRAVLEPWPVPESEARDGE